MKLFCNCKEEKQQILKTFEDTILAVMTSIEKTNNKFYEMATKIEVEHFKQLEKQSDKQSKLFDKNVDKFLTPAQFANIKSVRFEGEEEIFPVSVE